MSAWTVKTWLLIASVVVLCGVFGYACWVQFAPRPIPAAARTIADEGTPIVRAIQQYRMDVGLWPQRLEDLQPHYLEVLPAGWEYHWWPMATPWRLMHGAVWADNGMTHWTLGLGRAKRPLDDRPLPEFRLPDTRDSKVQESALAELARRCDREPAISWHWKGRVSLLIRLDRRDDAIDVCAEGARALPADWWPRAVQAQLLIETGHEAGAVKGYAEWCDEHPVFSQFWYLSLLYRQLGEKEAALNALEKMSHYPLGYREIDMYEPGFIGYDAASYAYVNERYELVLALCSRWPARLVDGWGGCVDAMCTLAMLALEDFDGAQRCAKRVDELGGHPNWVNDWASIRRAVEARDSSYRHKSLEPPLRKLSDYLIEYE